MATVHKQTKAARPIGQRKSLMAQKPSFPSPREGPSGVGSTGSAQRPTVIVVQPLSGSLPLTSRPAMIRQVWEALTPR